MRHPISASFIIPAFALLLGACSAAPTQLDIKSDSSPLSQSVSQSISTVLQRPETRIRYKTETVDGIQIFFREVGDPNKQAVILLHGFPSSSHMYRDVLDALGDEYYLIAPDYPGFGDSEFPDATDYDYSFDNLAETMDKFLIQKGLNDYVLMIHDYGAPVGMRIATKHPEKVKALITMNGNAYEEGLSPEGWGQF